MGDVDHIDHIIRSASRDGLFTRRQFITRKLMLRGIPMWQAIDAVTSVQSGHPDWNMDEKRTWENWEELLRGGDTKA